jgi:uncharacterized membrane protein
MVIKRYLMAGLLVWVPVGVTFFVLKAVIELMDKSLAVLPEAYRPDSWLGVHFPGMGMIFLFVIVWLTGMVTANFIGRYLLGIWERLLDKIPLVRSIYSAVRKVMNSMMATGGESFRRVLLVEYPRKGVWSIAFQTNEHFVQAQEVIGEDVVMAFVPTTPNPTSGFIVCFPKSEVQVLDMSVDEALKTVISLGVVLPEVPEEA